MKKISDQDDEVARVVVSGGKRAYTFKSGYHYLVISLALVSISAGLFMVAVSIAGIIKPLFLSGIGSMIGSVAIMLGGFVLYEEVTSSKDRGRLLHDALNRVIKDHN
jgi:hypothetical protein